MAGVEGDSCRPIQGGLEPMPIFDGDQVRNEAPARRVLYSWTRAEDLDALRTEHDLFGNGARGPAFLVLDEIGRGGTTEIRSELARAISAQYAAVRRAWPSPWATRLLDDTPGLGKGLVRIVLKDDAWVAKVMLGTVTVVDVDNAIVSAERALAEPARIGAVYFVKDEEAGGTDCWTSQGTDRYRELILGSEAAIAEWSVATPEIRERLDADVAALTAFFERARACPPVPFSPSFEQIAACAPEQSPGTTELNAYLLSLSVPVAGYEPSVTNLASLVATLENDDFEPDPLVVTTP